MVLNTVLTGYSETRGTSQSSSKELTSVPDHQGLHSQLGAHFWWLMQRFVATLLLSCESNVRKSDNAQGKIEQ